MTTGVSARNINDMLHTTLQLILEHGEEIGTRDGQTQFGSTYLELRPFYCEINEPKEIYLTLPARKNSLPAVIAETFWVMAGRDDLKFLSMFLPRAKEFSDDGLTWRAAYGPRLRSWPSYTDDGNGNASRNSTIDQIERVIKLLQKDPNTRQAVISIFDPARDTDVVTKDIPCNNWIQFLNRNGVLDMMVTVRSNDVIWGLSGINYFEWTFLQQMVASAIGSEVGRYCHFVGSMHLYSNMVDRAKEITAIPYVELATQRYWQQIPYASRDWFNRVCDKLVHLQETGEYRTLPDSWTWDPLACMEAIVTVKLLMDKGMYRGMKLFYDALSAEMLVCTGPGDGHLHTAFNYVKGRYNSVVEKHGVSVFDEKEDY